jgi:AraC-like DNA-binding protein
MLPDLKLYIKMKAVEKRPPQEVGKSFSVFTEVGQYFPVPWHYHPEYELVSVVKSSGRRMVGDNIGNFDEGDLVLMGPLLPHVWVNDPAYKAGTADHQAKAIVIQFVENFLGENFLNLPEIHSCRTFLELSKNGIVIKGAAQAKINALMKKILFMNALQRLSVLFSIFDILSTCRQYELLVSPGFLQKTPQLKCSDRFNNITEYIMRNFDRDISLTEIASVANMGVTSFCNFFKDHYKTTFIEYLNSFRIGHACKLLAENDETIIGIAYDCGYNSLANFNRQFKKLKNMNPSEFRKTMEV